MPTEKKLLQVLKGTSAWPPPVWLMRQAGRYLPEYRKLREGGETFLEFCYSPELAVEATLQPLRRFDLDAAILFCDILVIPDALGQKVSFEAGTGPRLDAIDPEDGIADLNLSDLHDHLAPVYETVARLKTALDPEVALIGFAGAPWTVATYMVEGSASRDYATVRSWAYMDPVGFAGLMDLIVDATTEYLDHQITAGAEAIQLFDSWAGVLPETEFSRWVVEPTAEIVRRLKSAYPDVPIIGFPKGAGVQYRGFCQTTGIDAISLDSSVPLDWAVTELQPAAVVQGNLDNILLATGGTALDMEVRRIIDAFANGPHVFNLGHGILPHTPPENVERLIQCVRDRT